MQHRKFLQAKPSIMEAPKFELKHLPPNLSYLFLVKDDTLTIIIALDLNAHQVESLVKVFKRFKWANSVDY